MNFKEKKIYLILKNYFIFNFQKIKKNYDKSTFFV